MDTVQDAFVAGSAEQDRMGKELESYFAPAVRRPVEALRPLASAIASDPLAAAIMKISGEIVAILDENRQIVAVNDGLLAALGVKDVERLVGLRPGEALGCIHAGEQAGGCGTSRSCSDCGAVVAILLAQASGHPVDRECRIVIDAGSRNAMEFLVRAVPFELGHETLVALILHRASGSEGSR